MADGNVKTTPHTVTFEGSVTPKATKFLKSEPIEMDFTGTIELDETDASNLPKIQAAFQKEMQKRLDAQLGHLNTWLAERDKVVASMVARFEALKGQGFPADAGSASTRAAAIKELGVLAVQIEKYPEEYREIVKDWAVNVREQQALVSMQAAVKAARIKTFSNKAWRVRLGQAVKVTLVVAAVALTIAAIVLTAGTTAPVFVALASAGVAISGVSGIAGIAKSIHDSITIEKKLMANLSKDVESLAAALAPVESKKSSIAKHVTELRNLSKIKQDSIQGLQAEIQKKTAEVNSYRSALAKVKGDATIAPAEIAKREKQIAKVDADLKSAQGKISGLRSDIEAGKKVLADLEALHVQLDKISGQAANTVAGNLKARFTSIDGWTDLGNTVGGLVSGASGVHS